MTIRPWTAALCLLLPLAATAQGIWRCGADGRSYSDVPCAEGRALETPQARPADEVAQAQQRALQERRQADAATRERLAQETALRGNGLAAMAPAAPIKPVSAKAPARKAPHRLSKQRHPAAAAGTSPSAAPSSRRARG